MKSTRPWKSRLREHKLWSRRWSGCANWSSNPRPDQPNWRHRRNRCRRCRGACWNSSTALPWPSLRVRHPPSRSRLATHAAPRQGRNSNSRRGWKPETGARRRSLKTELEHMSRELHIVGFKVGRETYGVPITSLHEIVRVPEITAVPDAPDYLEGVINLRGKIVSVMDLRKRFGEKDVSLTRRNRILVV